MQAGREAQARVSGARSRASARDHYLRHGESWDTWVPPTEHEHYHGCCGVYLAAA